MASVRLVPSCILSTWAILVCILVFFLLPSKTYAQSDSPWLNSTLPEIENQDVTVPRLNYGNRECINIASLVCEIRTSYGYFGAGLRLNYSSFYYPVLSNFGDSNILPVPNSDTVITYFSHPSNGQYLFFTKEFSSSLKLVLKNGSLFYQSSKPPDSRLKDKSGRLLLAADFDGITFSKNGRWMLAHAGGPGFLRVDMETFEILPFGPKYRFDPGTYPHFQTAISDDGRYAAVASAKNGGLRIYDLNTCGNVPDVVIDAVACESKDIFSALIPKVPGFIVGLTHIRFLDEDTIHLFVIHQPGSGNVISKYSVNAGGSGGMDYLALGDSYISGEGVFSYKEGTDISTNRCHLSNFSYPYLIGNLFKWSNYESVACSGSILEDIIPSNERIYNAKERQGKGKPLPIYNSEIYANFLPGYRGQINFVRLNTPGIVTISIGGNDIGFDDILKRCLAPVICYETYEDRLEMVRQINAKFDLLVETYEKIKESSLSSAKIYVIGYPQIIKTGGVCSANVHLHPEEIAFSEQLISYLNLVIKNAASRAGVFYVDIESALKPYRLCENEDKLTAVHGLTAGNDAPISLVGPIGKESYHPNAFGHELIRNRIIHETARFARLMPGPDLSAAPPSENNLQILSAVKSNRQTYRIFYDSQITAEFQVRGGLWRTVADGIKYSLKPFSPINAVLNSSPVQLGTYMTDSRGNIDIQIQTPLSIPAGYHTLHLYGSTIENQVIDIYRVIYVAASVDDIDGDGIKNSSEKCLVVEPSNQDYDNDSIDDACDGVIGEKPPTAEPVRSGTVQSNTSLRASTLPAIFSQTGGQVAAWTSTASAFSAGSKSTLANTGGAPKHSDTKTMTDRSEDSAKNIFIAGAAVALAGGFAVRRLARRS